jgi:hypothetical protein
MTYPTWNTPAGSIGTFPSQVALAIQLSATATLPATQITYAVISGSLPNGISMNSTGLISGIPSIVSSDTVYRFVVRATDDKNGIADRTFNLIVSGVASPRFTTPTGTILNTNDSVWIELPITYSNPVTTNPVSIRVAQGLLPPGLEVNSYGVIRGYAEPPVLTVNYPPVSTSALSISSNVISVLSTTNFVIDRPIIFTGSVYGGIVAGTTYYVRQIFDSTTFTVSETRGGSVLVLSDGVGDMTVTLPQIQVGQPSVQTYSFTLELDSPLGEDYEAYSIVVANQNAPISAGGPGRPPNSRTPSILNTRPLSFDVAVTDPTNYGYYVFPNGNVNETYPPSEPAYLGKFQSGEYFAFRILGKDFDGNALTYQYAGLPLGLIGDPVTGWITGTPTIADDSINQFQFSVSVKKSSFAVSSTTFNYSFRLTNDIDGVITWVTPSDLGQMFNSETSVLALQASCDVELNYRIVEGSLPPNLQLLSNGEISGVVAYQPTDEFLVPNSETTFNFTVEAYSPLYPILTSTRQFSILVVQEFIQPTDTLYIKCVPSVDNRLIIRQLLENDTIIPNDYLYRAEDPNFGKASSIIYQHAFGIYASDFEEYVAAITKNHYWRNITLGQLKTAQARNDRNEVVYEVVYSEVIDNLVNPEGESISEEVIWPRPIPLNLGPWYTSVTNLYTSYIGASLQGQGLETELEIEDQLISTESGLPLLTELGQPAYYTSLTPGFARALYPNSLYNMRTRVGQNLGQEYDFRLLPKWMTSQQANGSTLGFTPAWVIAYCKPGYADTVKSNIETMWLDPLGSPYTLNDINFKIDRFTVDKSITYNYDNNVNPPAWTTLPSATPSPDPKDSKDFHVLFPRKTILPNERNITG